MPVSKHVLSIATSGILLRITREAESAAHALWLRTSIDFTDATFQPLISQCKLDPVSIFCDMAMHHAALVLAAWRERAASSQQTGVWACKSTFCHMAIHPISYGCGDF